MHQMTQEAKSLWRIGDEYIKDAAKTPAIKKFWQEMKREKEKHIEDLRALIKAELK